MASNLDVVRITVRLYNSLIGSWIIILLRDKKLCVASLGYTSEVFSAFTYNQAYKLIRDFDLVVWSREWIDVSHMNLGIICSSLVSYNLINHLFGSLVLILRSFYKYIS